MKVVTSLVQSCFTFFPVRYNVYILIEQNVVVFCSSNLQSHLSYCWQCLMKTRYKITCYSVMFPYGANEFNFE